jgi:hypothetical protein
VCMCEPIFPSSITSSQFVFWHHRVVPPPSFSWSTKIRFRFFCPVGCEDIKLGVM